LDDRIVRGDKISGSIIIKEPIRKTTKWGDVGLLGNIESGQDLSKLKPVQVSWDCSIVNIGCEKIFMKERGIITVKCSSNISPNEVVTWRYASGLGLIENTTEYKNEEGEIVKMNVMSIVSHESSLNERDVPK
jgi:hypothetical protein